MAIDTEIVEKLREAFSDPSKVAKERFALLQQLSQLAYSQEDNIEAQELVLRALEHREQLADCKPILDAIAREFGLFPYLDPDTLAISDKIAYEFHRPVNMEDGVVFHRPQARVYRMLLDGESVALSAPTSFGKSLIIDAIIATDHYRNIVIIVPTIALIDETRRRLTRKFRKTFKIITHTFQARSARNIFVLTQERALEFEDLENIDFFVIDEFYKLSPSGESDIRSYLLNQAFYKLLKTGRQFYMLGPSITGITSDFQKSFECRFIVENYQTVVSEIRRTPVAEDESEFEALIALCKQLTEPTIIFCRSPKRAQEVTEELSKHRLIGPLPELNSAVSWISQNYSPQWHFVKALQNGIGVHHGRIPRSLAQYAVRKFDEGKLRFLICTSTLIEGVNSSAKNIIIFDNKINKKRIDLFTFNNIRGRSGRMFKHFIGYVYIFHDPPDTGLPFVDIPIISQPETTPESLLIQIADEDLKEKSRERLKKYEDQDFLGYNTLKQNYGIDLDDQLELAEAIANDPQYFHENLYWSGTPTYEQVLFISQIIWKYFNGQKLGSGSAKSDDQLAFSIKKLESTPSIRELINSRIEFQRHLHQDSVDDAVQVTLDFIQLWANFNFPRLLRAIDRLQRDVFRRFHLPYGSYESYANQVENLFLDPTIMALDEYGIPLELARRLIPFIQINGDLDKTLREIRNLKLSSLNLTAFEIELITDARQYF